MFWLRNKKHIFWYALLTNFLIQTLLFQSRRKKWFNGHCKIVHHLCASLYFQKATLSLLGCSDLKGLVLAVGDGIKTYLPQAVSILKCSLNPTCEVTCFWAFCNIVNPRQPANLGVGGGSLLAFQQYNMQNEHMGQQQDFGTYHICAVSLEPSLLAFIKYGSRCYFVG